MPSSTWPESSLGGAAALALALLLVAGALAVVVVALAQIRLVVLAVVLALALTALLVPFADALHGRACPRGVAALVSLVGALVVLGAIAVVVVPSVVVELGGIGQRVREGGEDVADFVLRGGLGMSFLLPARRERAVGMARRPPPRTASRGRCGDRSA